MTDFQELDRTLAGDLFQGLCRERGTRPPDFGQVGDESCQNELLPNGTSLIARAAVLMRQTGYYLRNRGLVATIKRVLIFLVCTVIPERKSRVKQEKSAIATAVNYVEILNLQPGEWVEVKSEEDIRLTLDNAGRHRGLTFTPDMREYCGRRLRVFKRVRQICMETRPNEMRRLENTVILDGAICNGGSRGCDRACFFFWREAWLRRSGESPRDVTPGQSLIQLKVQ